MRNVDALNPLFTYYSLIIDPTLTKTVYDLKLVYVKINNLQIGFSATIPDNRKKNLASNGRLGEKKTTALTSLLLSVIELWVFLSAHKYSFSSICDRFVFGFSGKL